MSKKRVLAKALKDHLNVDINYNIDVNFNRENDLKDTEVEVEGKNIW